MPPNEEIIHKDKLGRLLKIGDCVVYPAHNSLEVGTVKKLNKKMVKVWRASAKPTKWYTGSNKYPNDIVIVDGPEVTMYLLKLNSAG
jgi:hypothetical protein